MLGKTSAHSNLMRSIALFVLAVVLIISSAACSEETEATPAITSPSPTATETPAIIPTATPTIIPTSTPVVTTPPAPTPEISFPPLETNSTGGYGYPQAVADKTSAMTNDPVNFKIITSEKVKKIQTIIDGDAGSTYTKYTSESGVRIWRVTIYFTLGGSRKVQFKCSTDTGGTVYVPKTPIKIDVTFKYTAESTSKTISSGKTVTFTLKTPSSIEYINVLVDGVNQNIKYNDPASDEDGVKIWKIKMPFFKLGTREVTFNAYVGTKVKKTFPEPGITIVVQ